MGGRPSERAAVASSLAVALFLAASCATVKVPELVVSSKDGGVLAVLRLPDGAFEHRFVHSFHLTPVEERFELVADGTEGAALLHLHELRYESSGVGMPEGEEGGYRLEDGKFILSMDRSFDRIPVFVSIVPGHGIAAGGIFHPFTEWARPMQLVVLTGRMSIVRVLGGKGQ